MLSLNSKPEPRKEIKPENGKIFVALTIAVAALILGIFLFITRTSSSPLNLKIESDFQAVFLENGQVYFGSIDKNLSDSTFVVLKNVYYLSNQSETTSTDINLIKLGDELHGPGDRMDINLAKVLFIEDLSPESKVLSAIKADK